MSLNNPYIQDNDLFSQVVQTHPEVQKTMKSSFQNFLQLTQNNSINQNNLNPNFMTKFITMFSKHTILTSLISLIVFGSITISALELFAPDDFKPISNIENIFEKEDKDKPQSKTDLDITPDTAMVLEDLKKAEEEERKTQEVKSEVKEETKPENPSTQDKNLKTYTNPYFPTLKIVYPEDWQFETTTTPSWANGLVNRSIILKKSDIYISIYLSPKIYPECGGAGGEVVKSEKFDNGVFKKSINFEEKSTADIYMIYGFTAGIYCDGGVIDSNLDTSISSNYKTDPQVMAVGYNDNDNKIKYDISLKVGSGDMQNFTMYSHLKSDNALLSEIDQIISQSSFN